MSASAYADCIRLICSLTACPYHIRFAIPLTAYTTCILKAVILFSLPKTRESQGRPPISVLLRSTKTKRCPGCGSISVRPSMCLSFFLPASISGNDRPHEIGLMTSARPHSPHSHSSHWAAQASAMRQEDKLLPPRPLSHQEVLNDR